jgi:hypothetical protein
MVRILFPDSGFHAASGPNRPGRAHNRTRLFPEYRILLKLPYIFSAKISLQKFGFRGNRIHSIQDALQLRVPVSCAAELVPENPNISRQPASISLPTAER